MPEIFRELGSTGLKRWGGLVYEEYQTQLMGDRAMRIYREMSNDPVIAATLFVIKMLIRAVTWDVEPYSEDQVDKDGCEFLQSALHDMSSSWSDTINDILSFLVYGWSYCEIVYKRRLGDNRDPTKRSRYTDGKVSWRKIPIRAQETRERWVFDSEGGIRSLIQRAPPDYGVRDIPIEKALLFRTDTSRGNPEGTSILRSAYRPWFFKKHIEEIEGIGVERDLAGLPVGWVPPEVANPTTPEATTTRTAFLTLVTNIRRDKQEGVLLPLVYDDKGNKLYDLQLLSTGGRRQFDTTKIIERYSRQMAMTVLADFVLLGHEKVGSFALSESKTNLFVTALRAWLESIAAVFNRHAIPRLWRLNGWSTSRLPKLIYGETETPDLKELASYIESLAGAGAIVPDERLEIHLRQLAKLPTIQKDHQEKEQEFGNYPLD